MMKKTPAASNAQDEVASEAVATGAEEPLADGNAAENGEVVTREETDRNIVKPVALIAAETRAKLVAVASWTSPRTGLIIPKLGG